MSRGYKLGIVVFLLLMAVAGALCGNVLKLKTSDNVHVGAIAPPNPASPAPYVPTPTPTATPAAKPVDVPPSQSRATTAPTARPPVATTVYRNRVIGPGVNVVIVGTYTDCTGKAAVGWSGAYFDSCFPAPWIMAHPTFFGAMNSWSVGTAVTWWDGNGTPHTYHIIDITVYPSGSSGVRVDGSAHFQVCTQNINNSPVRVLNAA